MGDYVNHLHWSSELVFTSRQKRKKQKHCLTNNQSSLQFNQIPKANTKLLNSHKRNLKINHSFMQVYDFSDFSCEPP